MMLKALTVNFLRNAGFPDTSMGGVSVRFDDAYLIGEGVSGPWDVPENAAIHNGKPVLRLYPHERHFCGPIKVLTVVPNDWFLADQLAPGRCCFGGNFIYSTDSRFCDLNDGNPIKVHDRNEFQPNVQYLAPYLKVFEVEGGKLGVRVHHDYGRGKAGIYVTILDGDGKEVTPPIPLHVWRDVERFIYCPRVNG